MLQVQEDGVLSHKVPQQLGHVGDAVRDDGQPLPARHVAPGQALRRGQARQISWGLAALSGLRWDGLALFYVAAHPPQAGLGLFTGRIG